MMKQWLSWALCCTLLFSPTLHWVNSTSIAHGASLPTTNIQFAGMGDPRLIPYLEDSVYMGLVEQLGNLDDATYFIEDISAVCISQEYLTEIAAYSKENVFFGYTLSELDTMFSGTRYVFTVGVDGQTAAVPLEVIPDTAFQEMLTNVAIGTGVILVCVTISVVTPAFGAHSVSAIFACATKKGIIDGLSGAFFSGVSTAMMQGYMTGDMEEALRAGALRASEGFKWGAIFGAVSGAASKTRDLYSATRLGKSVPDGLTMNQAALIQRESGFPLNVIRQLHTFDEYQILRDAGLNPQMINGKLALIRTDIDLNRLDEYGRTNLQRMLKGLAALDDGGKAYELHHLGMKNDGTLSVLTTKEHDAKALHGFFKRSEINRPAFDAERKEFWQALAEFMMKGQ